MADEVTDANELFKTIANLSIAQTQILEMLQEVIPALLEEQREMRNETAAASHADHAADCADRGALRQ